MFYAGALFKATRNTEKFSNAQVMMMLDVPMSHQISTGQSIKLFVAPPGAPMPPQLFTDRVPTRDELEKMKWTEMLVDICPDRTVTKDFISAFRHQYCLKHLGSSTMSIT